MFDAVIFDLDGTLVDSERAARAAALEVFAAHGHPVGADLLHRLIGLDEADSAAILHDALGPGLPLAAIHRDLRARVRAEFAAQGVPLRPGARDLIGMLAARGLPMAVATSSRRESAEWKLTRAGLMPHLAALVSLDCVTRAKPAPEPYLLAAARLGADPARCLAFEDSDTGARAARAAGMVVVQVPDLVPTEGAHATLVAADLIAGARAAGLIR